MAKLKSNIIFNFMGSVYLGILTLAVTPIQVHFLGVEAFGFVGLITILQVLLGALDLGISATVTKVVSSDHSHKHHASADAVNTASSAYWVIAVLISTLLWQNSETVASFWLSRTHIDTATITLGLQIIAVYLGLRWPVAFYSGVINGLQRMDLLNIVKASVQTLRMVGGVTVLFFVPDLIAFLVWFAISSAIELMAFAIVTYRLLPTLRLLPYFSHVAFRDMWRYSAAMNLIALTALVLSQADRLAVTKFLSLEALGYYSIAYNASIAISLLQSAINTASFPAFSHSFSMGHQTELMSRYNKASQLMVLFATLPCLILIFFGREILQVWINSTVADEAALTMAWLAFGFYINATVSTSYIAAVACDRPEIPLKINLFALIFFLPTLYWLLHEYGISGAAAAYAGMNAFYLFTLVPSVQASLIKQGMRDWIFGNLLPFLLAGIGAMGISKTLSLAYQSNLLNAVFFVIGILVYLVLSWPFVSISIKTDLKSFYKF